MKQLATMDDIIDVKDAMDSLLNRIVALEYTVQDLQRSIDNLRNTMPSIPSTYISCNQPVTPTYITWHTYSVDNDGFITINTDT